MTLSLRFAAICTSGKVLFPIRAVVANITSTM